MPTPDVLRTTCPLDCPDACALEITREAGRITKLDGASDDPVTNGFICGKVRGFTEHVYSAERILYPARRTGAKGTGEFARISWEEAYDLIAERIRMDRSQFGGESILPLCYGGSNGRLTHNAVDLRLFYRLGASHLDRTVCAAPAGAAFQAVYGKMPGVAFEDYVHSQLIVVWGNNPHASGVHLVPFIREGQKRGAKLVVLDPRRTSLAAQADLHLPLFPGTDLPVALAVINALFDRGFADEEFLRQHTRGQEQLRERAARWSVERAAEVARISPDSLTTFIDMYAASSPAVIRCGWGPERNRNGGSAIAAILAIPAVANKFGVRGGGFTMSNSGAWQLDSSRLVQASPPETRHVNMSQVGEALLSLNDPPVRTLFVYNCNPVATMPAQNKVRNGLLRDDLFTIVYDQVMTDTAAYADILLPATTFLEHHDLKNGYGYPRMGKVAPIVEAQGESRPNYEVFGELIDRLDLALTGDHTSPEELTAAVITEPSHRADLNAGLGILPPSGRAPVQMQESRPGTADGRIDLFPDALELESQAGLYQYIDEGKSRYPLALLSPCTSHTVNSTLGQTLTELSRVTMHPVDAANRQLNDEQFVRVYNELGEVILPVRVSDQVSIGVVEIPKGIWSRHTRNGQTSNALSPDMVSDIGAGACFNDARVEVVAAT
ncbi:MAG: molybdopterin-dependent oxidoreductase [Planctomycetales bacterium]|nr:molybdopterin-dependent oxidoreductase [Planctomycetales bacterium]